MQKSCSEQRYALRVWVRGYAPQFESWHDTAWEAESAGYLLRARMRPESSVRMSVFDRYGERDLRYFIDTWTAPGDSQVRRFLTLSTCHMTERDSELLAKAARPGSSMGPAALDNYCYGWFVYLPAPQLEHDHARGHSYEVWELCEDYVRCSWVDFGMSRGFIQNCRRAAREYQVHWVMFDCDGEVLEGYDCFDW